MFAPNSINNLESTFLTYWDCKTWGHSDFDLWPPKVKASCDGLHEASQISTFHPQYVISSSLSQSECEIPQFSWVITLAGMTWMDTQTTWEQSPSCPARLLQRHKKSQSSLLIGNRRSITLFLPTVLTKAHWLLKGLSCTANRSAGGDFTVVSQHRN